MRRLAVTLFWCGLPMALYGQAPRLDPNAGRADTTRVTMSAADSISYHARITAATNPFSRCESHAFQTCGSGETAARLSLDGTAFGVVISVFDDRRGIERSIFLWRITGRVGIGAADDDSDPTGGGGGKGRRGGRSKRGG